MAMVLMAPSFACEHLSRERCCILWARVEASERLLACGAAWPAVAGPPLPEDRCDDRCETATLADSVIAEQRSPGVGVGIRCWITLSLSAVSL